MDGVSDFGCVVINLDRCCSSYVGTLLHEVFVVYGKMSQWSSFEVRLEGHKL